MYQLNFSATDDADWAQAIELIDATTDRPLADAADATFRIEVSECGSARLFASSDDGTIEKPKPNVIQWRFPAAKMGGLSPGNTYAVGCTMTTATGIVQLFIGSLAVVDGGF